MSENNLSQNNTSLDSQNNINFNDLIEKALNSPNSLEIIQTVTNHYPEMRWLTGNTNSTPEAGFDSEGKATYGEQIFPNLDKNLLIEFNRTAVGILILQWVFQNDYESFTNCQNENVKLSRESFEHLKQYIHKILPDYEAVDAMIVYMVINDLTKIKSIIKEIQDKAGIQEIDHDKLLLVALRDHPETSVSYGRLSPKYQKLILNGLSAEFNIGQFVQGENVPASLKGLKSIDKDSLDFFLLHALCDIAGAAGQFIQNGSIVMTEASYLGFHQSISSLEMLNNGAGVEEVYNNYLFLKSKDLGLNIEDLTEKAITRICCMLRYSNFDQAKEVKEVFLKLPINVQSILELELNKNGVNDGFAIIIYYSPALLVNLQKSMKDNFQEGLTIGLTTFARIYQESRISIRKRQGNGVFTVMASTIAKMASENPLEINKHEIYLEEVQNDAEAKLTPFPTIDKTIFPTINSLSEIKGSTILPVGVGGGSDCVQAAQLAELLIEAGKKIPAIVSVRTNTTSSQGTDGKIGEDRTPENAEEISQGVFLINPNTRMKGRAVESIISNDMTTYLILIKEGIDLTNQIQSLIHHLGNIDTIIGVDTGGDALYSTTGHEQAKATPDQDILVLNAINKLQGINTLSAEIAIGIDTPENGEEVLQKASAEYFEPNSDQVSIILQKYKNWELDGSNDRRFGKTPLSWQKALMDKFGLEVINLPKRVVIDESNPWKTFVNIQPCTKGIFFMDTENHIKAISG